MSLKRLHGLRKSDIVTIHLIERAHPRSRRRRRTGTHETDGAVVARARRSNEPQPRQTLHTGFADRARMRVGMLVPFPFPTHPLRSPVTRDARPAPRVP